MNFHLLEDRRNRSASPSAINIPEPINQMTVAIPLEKLATESLSKTTKVTKTAHIFTCSLLYNSDFVNFVKNDNEFSLSSVGFVTFDRLCTFEAD